MQGTVKEYSEETRSGVVLLDDGTEVPITPDSFVGSGVRFFRFGQRVALRFEGEGDARRVVSVTHATI